MKNIRDVFHLKSLNSLAVLDIWCNPMCTDQKYRLFVIYHLKNLKSLDGSSIEQTELIEAKDLFGGKLTCDFIAEKFFHSKFYEIKSNSYLSEDIDKKLWNYTMKFLKIVKKFWVKIMHKQ